MRSIEVCVVLAALGCGAKTGLWVDDVHEDTPREDAWGVPPDECIELPPEEPPEFLDVDFVARVHRAEVSLLVDVTGSMADEIERIRTMLRDVIVPEMVRSIPDVRLSVAYLADFPVDPWGGSGDVPFGLLLRSTTDLAAVQRSVDAMPLLFGNDEAEAQLEALYQLATGAGRAPWVPRATCPAGTVGYPCFAAEGARIVLLFTDAPFHNGIADGEPYVPSPTRPPPATYPETIAALRGIGAKVLGLWSGSGREPADLRAVAADTGAVDAEGEPLVRDIGTFGERLDTGVIDLVRSFAEQVTIDVDVLLEDLPGDDGDATGFVTAVEALRAEPPEGAVRAVDRFLDVRPGTRVVFRIRLDNETIPREEDPLRFLLRVVLRGDGVNRLLERTVEIVVPALDGAGCDDVPAP